MQVKTVLIEEAIGHIALHNQIGPDGKKIVSKGRQLTEQDIAALKADGRTEIYIAVLADDDWSENKAAHHVSQAITPHEIQNGTQVTLTRASTGRVNFMANVAGLAKINQQGLLDFNGIDGITLATVRNNTVVTPKKVVATLKIIPYALPNSSLEAAVTIARRFEPLLSIKPFIVGQAILITTGSQPAKAKVMKSFSDGLEPRLAAYGSKLHVGPYVPTRERDLSTALTEALNGGAEMIILAGETSIMDSDDIIPRAIKAIGGQIIQYGVGVEPGNLLMLAYHETIPIVGAPGCARSKGHNVVDMILPRLAAGERITRQDLISLGHGGYLK